MVSAREGRGIEVSTEIAGHMRSGFVIQYDRKPLVRYVFPELACHLFSFWVISESASFHVLADFSRSHPDLEGEPVIPLFFCVFFQ